MDAKFRAAPCYLPERNAEPVVREICGEDELMRAVAQVYARALGEARSVISLETPDAETQAFFREALTFLVEQDEVRYAAAELAEGRGWVLHFLHNRSSIELRLDNGTLARGALPSAQPPQEKQA